MRAVRDNLTAQIFAQWTGSRAWQTKLKGDNPLDLIEDAATILLKDRLFYLGRAETMDLFFTDMRAEYDLRWGTASGPSPATS